MKSVLIFCFLIFFVMVRAQTITGRITDRSGKAIEFAAVALKGSNSGTNTDVEGHFNLSDVQSGHHILKIVAVGFISKEVRISVPLAKPLNIVMAGSENSLNEVVVTGSMREMSKDDSPMNIDIITPKLFQKTTTPNLFEATSLVNGVKPQVNCNVCNTGDIHINGLEGPYTLILIDGMPIVSGLSSVYGLMGIPASMIDRLEIAKGPAGALYGSEAMGGTINLITKNASLAPKFYADYYGTTYLENNLDLGYKLRLGKKADWLFGSNMYLYDNKMDINNDGFTDVTLQKRASLFSKVNFNRPEGRDFSIAGRYVYEDRWGGQMNWNKNFRGGDSIYGESIYASRTELISKYQWPVKEKIFTQLSYNLHDQNSVYGVTSFLARQSTAFAQTYWNKTLGPRNEFLGGITFKNLWYDDNTVITQHPDNKGNLPENSNTIGLFAQEELTLDSMSKHKLLLGARVDYNSIYRFIPSPRIAYKWSPSYKWIFRVNLGTGFRIVNIFTEEHAALTGARQVVFTEQINPEKSYNGSVSALYKMKVSKASMLLWDASAFYYHFTNKIFANYDIDPNKVVYANSSGYSFSRGGSLNLSLASPGNLKFSFGVTYADVQNISYDSLLVKTNSRQIQAPAWSGNIIAGYHFPSQNLRIDVTGNWYGPQRLPILPNDFRPEYSPWFCLLNLQTSKTIRDRLEVYLGVKNLLNFIPLNPIMRPHDPFDKTAADKESNPNGYTFDPSYNYAPVQGIRGYVGIRLTID
jgi:outer membrane receptor for ferrienterochelin and colicins